MRTIFSLIAVLFFLIISSTSFSGEIKTLIFPSQRPLDTQPWTVPTTSSYQCVLSVDEMVVKWVEPTAGVTSHTGLLIGLQGISVSADCEKYFIQWDETWADSRDVVLCNIYYRNASFFPPYDFGLYQMVDVMRGTGWMLDTYPQIDTRRIYLFGSSGGGHLSLQLAACCPEMWAEIYAHSPITKITTSEDMQFYNYEHDPAPYGWNVNFVPPYNQGNLTEAQRRQLAAETRIRSPQWNFSRVEAARLINTPVYVFHGTADETTDYQHLVDLRSVIGSRFGTPGENIEANYAEGTAISNWTFWTIFNGGHSYAGAHPTLSNRAVATNTLCPNAFLSRNSHAPALTVDGHLPLTDKWQYRLTGPLKTCRISLVESSGIDDWMLME